MICSNAIKAMAVVLAFSFTQTVHAGALIGINMGAGTSPTNWTSMPSPTVSNLSNLIDENGVVTNVSFSMVATGGQSTLTFDAATIPQHSNPLENVASSYNVKLNSEEMTGIYRGLIAGQDYFVWIFGMALADFGSTDPIDNAVSITGAGPDVNFIQSGDPGKIWVNGELGDSSRDLLSFAVIQTADIDGIIQFTVNPNGSATTSVRVAGTAIQAVPEPTSILLLGIASFLSSFQFRRRLRV